MLPRLRVLWTLVAVLSVAALACQGPRPVAAPPDLAPETATAMPAAASGAPPPDGAPGVQPAAVIAAGPAATLTDLPGPGPALPLVRALARAGGTLYAATWSGLWRSDDGGRTWTESGLATEDIFGVVAAPADPDRIWAWSYGRLWATEDGGRTWAQDTQFGEFGAMALAPGEPEQGLAAGTTGAGDGRVQVRRTHDGGRTWSVAGTVPAAEAPWRLAISPADPRRALMAFNGGGLWLTDDAGATWREVTPAGHVTGAGLAWDLRRRDTLYAWFMRLAPDRVGPWELYRSDDAGATWQRLTPPPGGGLGNVWAVPDGDGVRLYAGVAGGADMALASSLDGGRTWDVEYAPLYGSMSDVLALPDGSLLAGGIGLYRRAAAGDGWAPVPGPAAGARISGLVRAGATLLAAGVPGTRGLARSRDGGRTWEPVAPLAAALPPMEWGALGQTAILQAVDGDAYLLAARADPGTVMYRWLGMTRDGGETWTEVSPSLPDPDPAAAEPRTFITAYLARPGGRLLVATDTLAAGRAVHTLWLRRVEGAVWQAMDLPARTFGFAAGPASTVYAATENGVYRSEDGGGTWQCSLRGLPSPDVRQIAVDPAAPDQVYAVTVARPAWSDDGGRTWHASVLLPAPPDGALDWTSVVPVAGRPGWAAAAARDGVWVTADGGRSWSPVQDSPAAPYLFPARPGILWLLGPGYGIRELALPATWPTAEAGVGVVDAAGHWTQLAAGLPLPTSLAVLSYGGQTWVLAGGKRVPAGGGAPAAAALPAALGKAWVAPVDGTPGAAVAQGVDGRLFRTADAGATWEVMTARVPEFPPDISGLAAHPGDARRLYRSFFRPLITGGYGAIELSKDGGVTWTVVYKGRSGPVITAATDPDWAVADTEQGPVFSGDRGATWRPLGLPERGARVLALRAGRIYAASGNTLLVSDDAGAAWVELAPPMAGVPVTHLAAGPGDPGVLYAVAWAQDGMSGRGAIGRSDDGGRTWTRISDEIGNPAVYRMAALPGEGGLVVLTAAGELWAYRP